MITVEQALEQLFALVTPMAVENVPLIHAAGRVLAHDVTAQRDQPPFAASSMDGYAIAGPARAGAQFTVIGESAAGRGYTGIVNAGQAVRIFTGAPMPSGTNHVVIQENTQQNETGITLTCDQPTPYVRPVGDDFLLGDAMQAPRVLSPADVALLAAMNVAHVPVRKRPDVALIATGDELVPPGQTPGPDQIIASNAYGLHGLLARTGAAPRLLPIAPDTVDGLTQCFELAKGSDLIVTIGGASVGDHDLVGRVAQTMGMEQAFYKIRMRPGKPLMAGRMGNAAMVGLPGNPVSSMVCGHVFLRPIINAMLGISHAPMPRISMPITADLPANGGREHYMRAHRTPDGVQAFDRQDSALLSVLSQADCLIVRPVDDSARKAGQMVDVIPLD